MSRWNPAPSPEGFRTCYSCKKLLPLAHEHFNKSSTPKNKGFRRQCRICDKEKYRKKYEDLGRSPSLNTKYKMRYGITYEDKLRMIEGQENLCMICGEYMDIPHVDHAPESNPIRIRGILCHQCNTGLGNFKDSVLILQKAIDYLTPP